MKNVCIVDDHAVVIEALKMILDSVDDIVVVGTFVNAEDFIDNYPQMKPDITIIDIDLPRMSGIDAIVAIKSLYKDAKFLVLTNYADDELLFNALRAGANGYLLKKQSLEDVSNAIEAIYGGGAPMTSEIAKKVVNYFHRNTVFDALYQLTEKEKQVLQFLVNGLLYKEIANEMLVTIDAIKKHTQNIYEKLQVRTRSEAIKKYLTN
ncbi:MAG: response regulator transcription factor [Ferruginibacter sp.]